MSDAYFEAWRGGVIDTMIGVPASHEQRSADYYQKMNAGILDKEAKEKFKFPAEYMFKDVPDHGDVEEPVEFLLAEMDRYAAKLAALRPLVERGDGAALEQLFSEARAARERWLAGGFDA